MKYEVAKYIKAKREDYDDTRIEPESRESFDIFRAQRCASDIGREIIARLEAEQKEARP